MYTKVREYCQKRGCNSYAINKIMKYDEKRLRSIISPLVLNYAPLSVKNINEISNYVLIKKD